MINILPQPKHVQELGGTTGVIRSFRVSDPEILDLCRLRFWNCPDVRFVTEGGDIAIKFIKDLSGVESDKPKLLAEQGYALEVSSDIVTIRYEGRAGLINGITTLKLLRKDGLLPLCKITDWPSLAVRAIA